MLLLSLLLLSRVSGKKKSTLKISWVQVEPTVKVYSHIYTFHGFILTSSSGLCSIMQGRKTGSFGNQFFSTLEKKGTLTFNRSPGAGSTYSLISPLPQPQADGTLLFGLWWFISLLLELRLPPSVGLCAHVCGHCCFSKGLTSLLPFLPGHGRLSRSPAPSLFLSLPPTQPRLFPVS